MVVNGKSFFGSVVTQIYAGVRAIFVDGKPGGFQARVIGWAKIKTGF
jgi:hypothetical protein